MAYGYVLVRVVLPPLGYLMLTDRCGVCPAGWATTGAEPA